jgi:hypothetical protein
MGSCFGKALSPSGRLKDVHPPAGETSAVEGLAGALRRVAATSTCVSDTSGLLRQRTKVESYLRSSELKARRRANTRIAGSCSYGDCPQQKVSHHNACIRIRALLRNRDLATPATAYTTLRVEAQARTAWRRSIYIAQSNRSLPHLSCGHSFCAPPFIIRDALCQN